MSSDAPAAMLLVASSWVGWLGPRLLTRGLATFWIAFSVLLA